MHEVVIFMQSDKRKLCAVAFLKCYQWIDRVDGYLTLINVSVSMLKRFLHSDLNCSAQQMCFCNNLPNVPDGQRGLQRAPLCQPRHKVRGPPFGRPRPMSSALLRLNR